MHVNGEGYAILYMCRPNEERLSKKNLANVQQEICSRLPTTKKLGHVLKHCGSNLPANQGHTCQQEMVTSTLSRCSLAKQLTKIRKKKYSIFHLCIRNVSCIFMFASFQIHWGHVRLNLFQISLLNFNMSHALISSIEIYKIMHMKYIYSLYILYLFFLVVNESNIIKLI